ncbi:DUF2213 domain-containing protein [Enterobacter hormaechei]|nr:hypothetical protein [Enterobacter hormaechei]UIW12910.1 MAG: hypothetical protein [Enterobacter phage ENC13]HCR5068509.1 DUF2213 domain-containing protein [Enterobacter hormaechei subsp. steigerwaltii]EHF5062600.1 DUF2213 domain-containing protein [Enterobacter hormaechei]MCL8156452.1 DUF2213 domain-containing protein [Enterobacter hormaechei]CZY73684.1 gp7 [Enterobacter hormaechei]
MKLSSIHVKSLAINASNISTTTINGQEHYVIRGAVPIVDDIVMNGGLYPAEEINNSYQTMERKLMPIGHPMVNGKYVSANDPQAVNDYYAGAWAQNVSKANDKVVMDVYVNKAVADTKPDGKRLIQRLDDMISGNNADPIHVSTGLLLNKEQKAGESKQKKYSWVAHNMQFDHIAILLDEPGAGTPEEGVGMFVNADGQQADVETTSLIDAANSMKDGWWNKTKFYLSNASNYSFDEICAALRNKMSEGKPETYYFWPEAVWPDRFIYEENGKYLQQKYLIDDDGKAELVGDPVEVVRKQPEYEIKTNGENDPMKELIINALQAAGKPTEGKSDAELMDAYNQMKADEAAAKKNGDGEIDPATGKPKKKEQATNNEEMPAWAKVLTEQVTALNSQINANSDKEKGEKRAAVKLAMNMSDEEVADLDGKALDAMYAKCQTSFGLNGAFRHQATNTQSVSEMPE